MPTGDSMHLRSEIMQKLKVSTGTGNLSTVTQNLKVQRKVITGTQSC